MRRHASAQIQLYGDVPVGSARFADLARGVEGVGYRRSKIDFVSPVRPHVLLTIETRRGLFKTMDDLATS